MGKYRVTDGENRCFHKMLTIVDIAAFQAIKGFCEKKAKNGLGIYRVTDGGDGVVTPFPPG